MDQSTPPVPALRDAVDQKLRAALGRASSWWPAWQEWLRAHSGNRMPPLRMGIDGKAALGDAPGLYVLEK